MIRIVEFGKQLCLSGYKIVSLLARGYEQNRDSRFCVLSRNQRWSVRIIDSDGHVLLDVPEIPSAQLTFRRHPIVFDGMVTIEATTCDRDHDHDHDHDRDRLTVCAVIEYHRNEKN